MNSKEDFDEIEETDILTYWRIGSNKRDAPLKAKVIQVFYDETAQLPIVSSVEVLENGSSVIIPRNRFKLFSRRKTRQLKRPLR